MSSGGAVRQLQPFMQPRESIPQAPTGAFLVCKNTEASLPPVHLHLALPWAHVMHAWDLDLTLAGLSSRADSFHPSVQRLSLTCLALCVQLPLQSLREGPTSPPLTEWTHSKEGLAAC